MLNTILLSSTVATTTPTSSVPLGQPNTLMNFLPLILIFFVFYFLLIRPQMKKQKEHQAMIESIKRGEKVVTAGGIIGTVIKVDEEGMLQVEIAPNVVVSVVKSTISEVVGRPKPANNNAQKEQEKSQGKK